MAVCVAKEEDRGGVGSAAAAERGDGERVAVVGSSELPLSLVTRRAQDRHSRHSWRAHSARGDERSSDQSVSIFGKT